MDLAQLGWQLEHSYTALPDVMYQKTMAAEVSSPELAVFNHQLANELGLDFSSQTEEELAALFSGQNLPEGLDPIAQAYAGHQFGHFTMLGDGRALLLGEHRLSDGRRVDLQLKGSGRTQFSRNGDGLAALGPMLREYIISEALYELGVPSTRSLAVVLTQRPVVREDYLPGAVLTRVASSHLRVGTFEFVAAQRDKALLEKLVHYTLERHYPEGLETENPALALLDHVIDRQLDLITHWMRIGFIHGVMNTDNMTMSGEAIDFGPCAFMDQYDHLTVFSSIDHQGRYAYGNQPIIAQWNLARFAEAILPLFDADLDKAISIAEKKIAAIQEFYEKRYLNMMRQKLGLAGEVEGDMSLINDLLVWMTEEERDFTKTFHQLTEGEFSEFDPAWLARWQARRADQQEELDQVYSLMRQANPCVIPRNHLVEEVLTIANEQGNLEPLHQLLQALRNPYDPKINRGEYAEPPRQVDPNYATFCGT